MTQPGPITINDAAFELGTHVPAAATPYPSVIGTSNLIGNIQRVTVTLPNLTHRYAADVDVLLVRTNDSKKVVLLSDVALNFPFSGVTLTLDDSASAFLPTSGAVTSGSYKPTNISASGDSADDFVLGSVGGPAGPYTDSLTSLAGISATNAMGWRLYVVDDKNQDAGTIDGWTLKVWTTPVITDVPASITNKEDTEFSFTFKVNDSDTPLADLVVSASSSDTNIVKDFAITGTGETRTVKFTPVANKSGTVTITLKVADQISKGETAITASLVAVVQPVNDAPAITLSTNTVTTLAGVLTTNVLYGVISDADPADTLTLFSTSSDTNVVDNGQVFFTAGSNGTNFFAIAPRGGATGSATVTIGVHDGALTNSAPITITVNAQPYPVFGTGTAITIPDNGNATPYPQTLAVSNVVGLIGKVSVTLADVNHPNPEDLDILLVSPTGVKVALVGQAGGSTPIVHGRITLDQDASANISDAGPIVSGTYRPQDYVAGALPSEPTGTTETSLAALSGTSANGTWSLYVTDRTAGSAGSVVGGFVLNILPAPTINGLATITTDEDTKVTVTFSVADTDGAVTNVVVSSPTVGFLATSPVTATLTGTNVSVELTPATNVFGTNNIVVVAKDNTGGYTATNTFSLRVRSVNDSPTIAPVAKQITYAGVPVIGFRTTVGDIESLASALTVSASSGNTKLLPNGNIIITRDPLDGTGATLLLDLYPLGTTAGTAIVTLTVSDGSASSTTTFELEVLGPPSPLFANPNTILIGDSGGTGGIAPAAPFPAPITVSGIGTAIKQVSVTLSGFTTPRPDDIDILLVSPTGKKIMLMSDSGGSTGTALNNAQLIFSSAASSSLPDETQIVSGTYRETDNAPADTITGVATPYSDTLASLLDTNPNGTWNLYVVDDTGNDKGPNGSLIAGGWMINFVTAPQISAIAAQTTPEDVVKRVAFTIGDEQPGIPVSLSATSTNTAVVENSGLVFEGSGASRTLKITPKADQVGETHIIVSATILGATSTATFKLTVTAVDDAPTITAVADQTKAAGLIVGPLLVTVDDKENGDPGTIELTATSSNTSLVPDGNVVISTNGATRSILILPNGTAAGETTITLTAKDSTNQKASRSFKVTYARSLAFATGAAIEIRDNATAAPYPSVLSVAGVNGVISKVRVTVLGLTHAFPDDAALLLVSPDNSKKVVLMANAGGGAPTNSLTGVTLVFDDAGSALPDENKISNGVYRPGNFGIATSNGDFPLPAPAKAYGSSLADFNGISPNGDWKLYVFDDTFSDAGSIAGGWILSFETAPSILPIQFQQTPEDVVLQIPIFLSDADTDAKDLRAWAQSVNQTLVSDTNMTVLPTNAFQRTLTIRPNLNQSGVSNFIGVFVADGTKTNATGFYLTVTPVDDAPSITTATNLVRINEDTVTNITFAVTDIDSTLYKTNTSILSGNTALVPQGTNGLVLAGPDSIAAGASGSYVVTATPAADQNGDALLTFGIKDATTTVTREVTLAVTPVNDAPTITGLASSTNMIAGGVLSNIPFTVGDKETAAKSLVVTAASSAPSIIPVSSIVLGGANESRLMTISAIGTATGTANITLTVKDETNTVGTATIAVTVNAAPGKTFANTSPITIRDNNTATGSPSTINVSGLIGKVHKVVVTLDGYSHTAPDDVDVLLVSPGGKKVVLMSDAGGRIAAVNNRVVIDPSASAPIPDDGPLADGAGTYQPSNYSPDEVFTGVAAPYTDRIQDLAGTDANGVWTLYVQDDTASDSGSISQGWSIKIVTAPTIATDAPTQIVQDEDTTATANLTVRDGDNTSTPEADLEILASPANTSLQPASGVKFTKLSGNVGDGIIYQTSILPATNAPADSVRTTNVITLTVTRKSDGARATTTVTQVVVPVNDPPTISRITEKTTEEDRSLRVDFLVSDVDTLPRDLSIQATSGTSSLIANTNLLVFGQNTNRVVPLPSNEAFITLIPNLDQVGSSTISLLVDDTSTTAPEQQATASFLFRVIDFNDAPTIATIANMAIVSGQSFTTNITVSDPEGSSVRVTATSSDERLVRNSGITITPVDSTSSTRSIRVATESGVTGSATITVTAGDGQKSATTTFRVSVVESRERAYANSNRFVISDNSSASEYPSVVTVSGLVGNVSKVRVALNGFAHRFPQDVDMLLVSPSGKKVLLMSDAGGGAVVTNLNVVFDDAAASTIPAGGPIASGTFQPSNYDGASDPFAAPAPAGPYATTLAEFNGTEVNGEWRLFVMDDTPSDAGEITGGWSLLVTTQPKLEGLTSVTVEEDTDFRVGFSIVDEAFAGNTFTFRTTTTNAAVVRTNDLVITGSEGSYSIRGTPVANASGSTEITVFALNSYGQEVSGKFSVNVTALNDRPTITDIPDLTVIAGNRTAPVEFNASDVETEKKNLKVDIQSSNSRLVPTNNVFIVGNSLTVDPIGNLSGLADITITVTDEQGASATTTFAVLVLPAPSPQFANAEAITIRDNNSATPYPSTIEVTGVRGNVARVTVTLGQVNHPYPADLDVLLVGPAGQKVILMSDAGGSGRLTNARLTFDDRGATEVPFNPSDTIPDGVYKPTNHQGTDTFPAPAPAAPYSSTLAAFAGTEANGIWSLYVLDDASPDSGNITGGWVLNIFTTDPTITPIADQVTAENVTKNIAFRVDDADTASSNLVVTAVSDNTSLVGLTITGTGSDRTLVATPTAFANGEANITVSVTDGTSVASTSFKLTVTPVNQGPEIAGLSDRSTPANSVLNVRFTVFDRDTALSNVVAGATSSTPSLGTVEVTGDSADRTLTFRPSGSQGSTIITVIANDGALSVTNNFALTIVAPYIITVSPIDDQNVDEGGVVNVSFSVSGSTNGELTVTGASSNTALIDRVEISGTGTNRTATLRTIGRKTGSSTITITATDDLGVGQETFVVNVLPLNEPVIGVIADQRTPQNVPAIVRLTVTDLDTPISGLQLSWNTSNTNIVRNVQFGLTGGSNVVATVLLVRNALGDAVVTIFADDGKSKVGRGFLLTVFEAPNEAPVFGAIPDQTTSANSPATVTLNIVDPDTAIGDLIFTSSTSNPGLVSGVTVDTTTGVAIAKVSLVADKTGLATVTITVNDGKNTVSQTFALLVDDAVEPVLSAPALTVVDGVTTVTLSWTGGGELESAPSLNGPWTGTGNKTGSFSEPATGALKFYRIKR